MKTINALYPGTFDPFHLGHLEVVLRAARLFDKVIVGVAEDSSKNARSSESRVRLAAAALGGTGMKNIAVEAFSGAATDFAAKNNCLVVVRGIRSILDAEYEKGLSKIYRQLAAVEVVCLMCHEYEHVSGSVIRQLAKIGVDLAGFVPLQIKDAVAELYK